MFDYEAAIKELHQVSNRFCIKCKYRIKEENKDQCFECSSNFDSAQIKQHREAKERKRLLDRAQRQSNKKDNEYFVQVTSDYELYASFTRLGHVYPNKLAIEPNGDILLDDLALGNMSLMHRSASGESITLRNIETDMVVVHFLVQEEDMDIIDSICFK